MAKVRCKETRVDTFFANFLYDQKVSRSHFLRKLNEVVDWDRFTRKLLGYYRGKGEIGQTPYNPTIMLKMLLLSYLWNASERMIEVGTVAGDKGYDDGDSHYYLGDKGINLAIRLNNYRTQKKDKKKEG